MNKIKIDIPKGHKASFDETKGEITFVELPKNPREKFNVWDDILDHHKMNQSQFKQMCVNLRPHQVGELEEELVVAAYNGRQLNDPLPKWGPDTPIKRYPIFDFNASPGGRFAFDVVVGYWWSGSSVGARHVFFNNEDDNESLFNLRDAVKKFPEQYERSRTL